MLEEHIQKIIELRHEAPYSVLGPHYAERERMLTIRAFLPQAERVYVLPANGSIRREMRRVHPAGLFVARIFGIQTLEYQLLAVDAAGQSSTFHDPYAIHEPSFTHADGQALQTGTLENLFAKLGAHLRVKEGVMGVNFTVWAPHASRVSVVGTFNEWDGRRHPLERHQSGVWELFVPDLGLGELYKYEIRNAEGAVFLKTDPLAFHTEVYPKTAAFAYDWQRCHDWSDAPWMARAMETSGWELPVAIHRVTLRESTAADPEQVATYGQLKDIVLPWLSERSFSATTWPFSFRTGMTIPEPPASVQYRASPSPDFWMIPGTWAHRSSPNFSISSRAISIRSARGALR